MKCINAWVEVVNVVICMRESVRVSEYEVNVKKINKIK